VSAGTGGLLFANAMDAGYYRTAYAPAQLATIVADAEASLSASERIGLVGDQWALTRAGQGSVGNFLSLVLALRQDPSGSVLSNSLGKINAINSQIATEEDHARLSAILRAQLGPVYAGLGKATSGESYDLTARRAALFGALGSAKDPAVLASARAVTALSFKNGKSGDPLFINTAIDIAAANGDAALYDKFFALSKDERDPVLQSDSLRTLSYFNDPALVTRTLDYAVSGQVRNQSSWVLIAILLSKRQTSDQAWSYVKDNWDKVHAQLTASSGARVVGAVGSFCSVEKREDVASFFATHKVDGTQRTLSKSIDSINACIQLRASQEPNLKRWLDQQR